MSKGTLHRALQYKICMSKLAANDVKSFEHPPAVQNTVVDNILSLVLGKNYIPRPQHGEDVMDAMNRSGRELDSHALQADAILNNPVTKRLGLSGGPLGKAVTTHLSYSPELSSKLSPLFGGDPAQAAKHLHRGLYNSGAFGPLSSGNAKDVMQSINDNFYKSGELKKAVAAKLAREKLVGGMGDDKPDSAFPKKELLEGEKHESEHTDDKAIAKEIAKDHLSERSDYYTALDRAKLGYFKY